MPDSTYIDGRLSTDNFWRQGGSTLRPSAFASPARTSDLARYCNAHQAVSFRIVVHLLFRHVVGEREIRQRCKSECVVGVRGNNEWPNDSSTLAGGSSLLFFFFPIIIYYYLFIFFQLNIIVIRRRIIIFLSYYYTTIL